MRKTGLNSDSIIKSLKVSSHRKCSVMNLKINANIETGITKCNDYNKICELSNILLKVEKRWWKRHSFKYFNSKKKNELDEVKHNIVPDKNKYYMTYRFYNTTGKRIRTVVFQSLWD